MKRTSCLIIAGFILGAIAAIAATKKLPDGPLILKAPEYASWSMTLVNADNPLSSAASSSPSASSSPVPEWERAVVVKWNFRKAKEIAYVQCVTKGGARGAVWMIGGTQVLQLPGQKSWFVNRHMASAPDPFWIDQGPYGYPYTGIVSENTYQDTVPFIGQNCFYFKKQVHDPIEPDPTMGNYDVLVYVDAKSRLPVFVLNRDRGYKYQFFDTQRVDLVPPPEVTNAIQFESKRRERLEAVPPHA